MENPYKILNIPINSSIEDVKKAYKLIALKSHPDKLNNFTAEEKNIKIKEFMNATNAYNKILNKNIGDDDYININPDDWVETFDEIMNSQLFKEMVNFFMKYKSKITKHQIKVDIKYSDYYSTSKKKLRLLLKKIEEPVYINLDCSKYPFHTINYFDDNDNEHEILINMVFTKNNNTGYYHCHQNNINKNKCVFNDNEDDNENDNENDNDNENENENKNCDNDNNCHDCSKYDDNDKINLIYNLNINTTHYIIGDTIDFPFLNKEIINIKIKPFEKRFIKKGYGINKGDFIINFIYNPIKKEDFNKLFDADKNEMVRILKILKNDIKI